MFSVGFWSYDPEQGEGKLNLEGDEYPAPLASGARPVPNSSVLVARVGRSVIVLGVGGYAAPRS